MFIGMIGMGVYNGVASVLRALGDSITPLKFLILASVLNIIMDLVFVIVFNLGIVGVGMATGIAQGISAIGCIVYAIKKEPMLRLTIEDFKPQKDIYKKCIRLGVPSGIQISFISISIMLLQIVINEYGNVVIASATAVSPYRTDYYSTGYVDWVGGCSFYRAKYRCKSN